MRLDITRFEMQSDIICYEGANGHYYITARPYGCHLAVESLNANGEAVDQEFFLLELSDAIEKIEAIERWGV